MSALEPDYDADPGRRGAWTAPLDVHDTLGPELHGRVLDVGCGEGRLAARVAPGVEWVGVDHSPAQLALCAFRPIVRADMRALPFADESVDELTHLWCLYHLDDPRGAIAEAFRVLVTGGRYFACTAARNSDPELVPEGYEPTTFDAEEALSIVRETFPMATAEPWDRSFFPLETRDEVRRWCQHNYVPVERAETVSLPLWLTKRGILIRATKD